MDAVTLSEALKIIESGAIFNVKVVSFDKKRTAQNGRVLHFTEARKESAHQKAMMDAPARGGAKTKTPSHYEHFTRNIRIYYANAPTMKVVKIHPLLIMEINGKKLLL